MKKIIALIIAQTMCTNAFAENFSNTYKFLHDYIDCLHSLEFVDLYDKRDVSDEVFLKNLYMQDQYLEEGRGRIAKWVLSKEKQTEIQEMMDENNPALEYKFEVSDQESTIRNIATALDMALGDIEIEHKIMIKTIEQPPENFRSVIAERTARIDYAFQQVYKVTGNLLFVIVKPAETKNPKGKIPFRISDSERKGLQRYLNKLFGDEFAEYKNLKLQKDAGKIPDFSVTIGTVSALHIQELLTTETYEAAGNLRKTKQP